MANFSAYIPTILPVADSLFQGTGAATLAGPREPLYNLGIAAGLPKRFRWIGSQVTNVGGLANNPNHECRTGYVVNVTVGAGSGSLTTTLLAQAQPWDPDIFLLQGGTNDIDPGVNNDSAATLNGNISIWLDKAAGLFSKKWQQIVLVNLLKRTDGTDAKCVSTNALLAATVAGKSYASRVFLVDTYAAVKRPVIGQGMNDAAHPNDEGCGDWANAIWASANFQAALLAARPS